jgi:hypothetical protein
MRHDGSEGSETTDLIETDCVSAGQETSENDPFRAPCPEFSADEIADHLIEIAGGWRATNDVGVLRLKLLEVLALLER